MTYLTNGKEVSYEDWVRKSKQQFLIHKQWMRISKAISKAFKGAEKGLITEEQFQEKLACVTIARKSLQAAQYRLNNNIK